MKIAISNLAWQVEEDELVVPILQSFAIEGVEIAPTKVWPFPFEATAEDIKSYRRFWQRRGIRIVALQSLLFGRPDLTIFENAAKRQETLNYLSSTIELGSRLGAEILVFGSPKNRKIGHLAPPKAEEIAIAFFAELGQIALQHGLRFCIEPNPKVYECDFITNSQQAFSLVTQVNSEGFKLHLDAAGMTLSEENMQTALASTYQQLSHFHISEPDLETIGVGGVDHQLCGRTLARLNYQGWTSIEMRAKNGGDNLLHIKKALEIATKYYGRDSADKN